jgi:ABC-type sugar transport system ATPase subunit
MAQLSLAGVRKSFGGHEVIHGVDLEIADGEFVVFVGPSGCGKSTMLRMISGLEDVSAGSIRIDERDVTRVAPSKRGIGMVFQSYALFPHMTAAENIGFGLRLMGLSRQEIDRCVREVATTLQIESLLARNPRELSGGERQRVAIGRAIIRNPKIFLFDEPLSNLDAALRVQMRLEVTRLHARFGATMIYVTHDQIEAMTLADRIVVFNGGRIEQVGAPMQLYERPANLFVARFIGSPAMNVLPGALYSALRDKLGSGTGRARQIEGVANIGVRPEAIAFASPEDALLSGRIEIVEQLGTETLYYVAIGADLPTVTVKASPAAAAARGQSVGLRFELDQAHLFDEAGQTISPPP